MSELKTFQNYNTE